MSQMFQVLLDKEECCKILAAHIAAQSPPGKKLSMEIVFWGQHPQQGNRPTIDFKQMLREKYLGEKGKKDDDLRLLEVGAIATVYEITEAAVA